MTMRSILSIILVYCCLSLAHAQPSKGTRFLSISSNGITNLFASSISSDPGDLFATNAAGGAGNLFAPTPLGVYGGLGELSALSGVGEAGIFILSAAPQAGYFLSDNTLLGGTVAFTVATDFDESVTVVGFVPFVRYYFNPDETNGIHFFGQAEIGRVVVLDDENFFDEFNRIPFFLGAGVTRMLNSSVGLDGLVGIRDIDLGSDGGSSIAFGVGINMFFNENSYNNRRVATANLQEGTFMVGGTSGTAGLGLTSAGGNSFLLQPQLFYFFNPQLAVGGGVRLGFGSGERFGGANFSTTAIGISPQVRYYFTNSGHQLWFLGGGLNINYDRLESNLGGFGVFSDTQVEVAVGGGVNSFITPHVALEIGPSIRFGTSSDFVRIGVDLGVQVFLDENY